MLVIGIDENGLGPLLGPLVVTGTAFMIEDYCPQSFFELIGDLLKADDSKKVFTPSRRGEAEWATLQWLRLFGEEFSTLGALNRRLGIDLPHDGPCGQGSRRSCPFTAKAPLPVWQASQGDDETLTLLRPRLEAGDIRPWRVRLATYCVGRFNAATASGRNKLRLDFETMLAVARTLSRGSKQPVLILCGKVGYTRMYGPWFRAAGINDVRVIEESDEASRYALGKNTEIRFIRDGDALHPPVAIASMIGKYVRELSMWALCRTLDPGGPMVSGYRNGVTDALVKRTRLARLGLGWSDPCFLRSC